MRLYSSSRSNRQLCHSRILLGYLVVVAVLGALSSFVNPIFEPPDELQHYQYVRDLVDNKTLPVQEVDGPISQSHQPPLYYFLGAIIVGQMKDPEILPERNPFWAYLRADMADDDNKRQFLPTEAYVFPFSGTALVVHILRLVSVGLALGTVVAVWLLAKYLWPADNGRIMLILSLTVLNPMFLYIAGAVNNDNFVILTGALLLWLVVARAIPSEFTWGDTTLIGVVWGIALLSKLTGLVLAATWGLGLLLVAWKLQDARFFISRFLLIVALALLIAGWWFWRNWLLYGEPLALEIMLVVWGSRETFDLSAVRLWGDLTYAWSNYWGRFGYGQVPMPSLVYGLFGLISFLGVTGGASLLFNWQNVKDFNRRAGWVVIFGTALLFFSAFFYYLVRSPTGANGRYLFPALPAIAAILTISLSVWLTRLKHPQWGYKLVTAVLLTISIYNFSTFLPWVYAPPKMLSEAEAQGQIDTPADVVFGEKIKLLGTAVSPTEAISGQPVHVTACWQALEEMDTNYTLFIRLLDNQFNSLGQRDTYPALGKHPTSFWKPGEIFCVTYAIPTTTDLQGPIVATIDLGIYNLETDEPFIAATQDGVPIDQVVAGQIKIKSAYLPQSPSYAQEGDAAFAQGVKLLGYTWSNATTSAGETVITLELVWQASGPLDASYTVFVHLLNEEGKLLAQDDHLPGDGRYPTNFWAKDDIIIDSHTFTVPEDASPGKTTIRTGLYQLETLQRILREPAQPEEHDFILLKGPVISATDEN